MSIAPLSKEMQLRVGLANPFEINYEIGDGRYNDEDDIAGLDRALSTLTYRPFEKQEDPDRFITRDMDVAIRNFQKDNNLKTDGWLKPGGETQLALNEQMVKYASQNQPVRKSTPKPQQTDNSQTDATGRRVSDANVAIPTRKPDTERERKAAILDDNKKAPFHILPNPKANGKEPLHAWNFWSEVKENERTIEAEAKKAGVDPDFVKAIVHLETTQGWYDRLKLGNKTIRPMNVHAEEWKDLGYSREDLKVSEKNVQAGIRLISKIQNRMPGASSEEIASVYNSLGTRKVTDYGTRVKKLMQEKPWEKQNGKKK
ncbi:MAG: hypothetical protein V4621_03735 [Pseudomonadota bacterium]